MPLCCVSHGFHTVLAELGFEASWAETVEGREAAVRPTPRTKTEKPRISSRINGPVACAEQLSTRYSAYRNSRSSAATILAPMWRCGPLSALTLFTIVLPTVTLQAQQQNPYSYSTQTNLVIVPTQVTTPQGDFLYGLDASQFLVTDNGVPQRARLEEIQSRSASRSWSSSSAAVPPPWKRQNSPAYSP